MSWASQRRASYAIGVILFFGILIGGPVAYHFLTIPPTCTDGIQNQSETGVDTGGPCVLLDAQTLSPSAILWARSFRVRDGLYNAAAYIQNPNRQAGVKQVSYTFGMYDEKNVLVAERSGTTFIMPGAVTPVFSGAVNTGNRIVSHTYFSFDEPLTWERLTDTSSVISLTDITMTDTATAPRLTAKAQNTSVSDLKGITFIVAVFDPAGNAFAVSQTALPELRAGETSEIIFTWPSAFNVTVGRITITPLTAPAPVR